MEIDRHPNAAESEDSAIGRPTPVGLDPLRQPSSADLQSEIAGASKKIYNERLKNELEPKQNGRYVAIEPRSERYFLGNTGTEALVAAHNAIPDARFYIVRIGHHISHSIGGHASRDR
ncbi:MAG TPA: hypothetical protein VN345_06325 [Blastocatellia bacterium]|nr:hypothetical protein [Blastocatellia bacterium]